MLWVCHISPNFRAPQEDRAVELGEDDVADEIPRRVPPVQVQIAPHRAPLPVPLYLTSPLFPPHLTSKQELRRERLLSVYTPQTIQTKTHQQSRDCEDTILWRFSLASQSVYRTKQKCGWNYKEKTKQSAKIWNGVVFVCGYKYC